MMPMTRYMIKIYHLQPTYSANVEEIPDNYVFPKTLYIQGLLLKLTDCRPRLNILRPG